MSAKTTMPARASTQPLSGIFTVTITIVFKITV